MSIKAMSWVWEQHLASTTKLVLLALADHADDEGTCWPRINGVAAKCGVSDRTVQRVLQKAQDNGVEPNEMDGVRDWIRNVEKKPSSFSLPTSGNRFYPDFLIRLESGGIIAAEYKGAHLTTSDESREKKRMGELWERRSNGHWGRTGRLVSHRAGGEPMPSNSVVVCLLLGRIRAA